MAGADGMIRKLPLRRRLDRRARHAGTRRAARSVRCIGNARKERHDEPAPCQRVNAPHHASLALPRLSRRAESLGTENAFVVLAEVNALIRQGKDIVSFCIGQPDFPTPDNVQEAAIAAIRGGKHGYTPSAGIDELRAAAAHDLGQRRGLDIRPDDVVVGAGAKPFIAYTIASVTDYGVGDEVIYPVPGFPIYESQIHANGAVPVPIYLRESRGFAFDPAELEAKITPNTRLLILNTPQNPTGGILDRENLDAIAEILARHPQVWVFADEIYSRLVYDGRFDSLATRPGMLERTIISDGASKTWAMTGWRIGYVANRALAPVFTRWITNTESCASQISQWAAVAAITGPQDAADAMRARFLERRDLIVRLLNDVPGITCATPGGAFYAWPNVTEACKLTGCADSEAFRKRLLHDAGIAVLADIHFGRRVPGDGQHIRFSYAASNAAIESGISRLADFVRKGGKAMTASLAGNRAARDAILGRVRKALGKTGADTAQRAQADAYIAAHAHGPRPAMPADLVARFMQRATDMASTVERIDVAVGHSRCRGAISGRARPAAGTGQPEVARRRVLARIRGPRLALGGACHRVASHVGTRSPGHHRSVLRHRRNGHAGAHHRRGHADGIGAAARYAHRRGSRGPRRLGDGRGVCAGPLGKRRHAACDEHDFRAVAHRRHRADHRARRAWAVSRPSAAAWLKRGVAAPGARRA